MSTLLVVLLVLLLLGVFGGVNFGIITLADPVTIIILVLVVLFLAGGGFYWRGR